MATLSISGTSAALALFEINRPTSGSLINNLQRNTIFTDGSSLRDTVTLSSRAASRQATVYSQDIFSSYVDMLQQQRRSQVMIMQILTGIGDPPSGSSLLNNYQALQYQQSLIDRVFNLKGDLFQSMFSITI